MTYCDCSCDDGDRPEVFNQRMIKKARKEYKCCECGDPILPGQPYEYFWGVWGADRDTYRTCPTCVAIRDDYCPSGHTFGELYETISECLGHEVVDPSYGEEDANRSL